LVCGLLAGIVIGRLFIIGHDACHQSYTPHRRLNKLLGRIAMLPSLTPYSLWQTGHNVVHHGYTNLKGVDFVWEPLTMSEYQTLTPARKLLERIYRSGWGSCLYYLIEMWWLRMFFPSERYMGSRRAEFRWDSAFVAVTGALWIGALVFIAARTGQSALALVGFGFVVPFLVWNALIGFVVYVHHTHQHTVVPGQASVGKIRPLRFDHRTFDLSLPDRRLLPPHHGAHRTPCGHEHPSVQVAKRAADIGRDTTREDYHPAFLLALVFRYRPQVQTIRLRPALLD